MRRNSWLAGALLVMLMGVGPAWCQDDEEEVAPAEVELQAPTFEATERVARDTGAEALVSNSFFDTDLRQALSDVALDAGVSIIPGDTVSGFVTLELDGVPLEEALDLLLQPIGYLWAEIRPGVYLVDSADPQSPLFPYVAETRVMRILYGEPQHVLTLLPARMKPFVMADPVGRRVIIEAPKQLMPRIVERIELLDTRPGQVMIEAMVIETSAGALREFDAEFATSHFGVSASGGIVRYESIPRLVSDPTNNTVRPKEGNIVLGLRWLLSNNQAQLRACPRIIALDGEQAKIEVGTEQYFSILTGSAAYAYTRLEKIDATIGLDILPTIIGDTGEVHCVIRPNVSDVAGRGEGGLPVITVRRAESTVRLTNGEAVVIGGLIEKKTTERKIRVPILSEIPLIGEAFKSTRRSSEEREIVILIAPHILDEAGHVTGPLLSDALLGAPEEASELEDAGR
ncbi:MAG: type II secretion system protein GspD [Armatimonadota bacterium]|jgi:type IV pilus assembly protein PilQ